MDERTEKSASRRTLASGLVIMGAVSRLLPHPPNMTSVGAMGLFAGSRLKTWQALLLPLLCMVITDPILGKMEGHAAFTGQAPIYASLMVNVLIGRWLAKAGGVKRVGLAALLCSLQFFVVTNFFTWLTFNLYPHTWAGLVTCYIAALPFFGRTLAGDLGYTAVFFGIYAYASRKLPRPAAATAATVAEV